MTATLAPPSAPDPNRYPEFSAWHENYGSKLGPVKTEILSTQPIDSVVYNPETGQHEDPFPYRELAREGFDFRNNDKYLPALLTEPTQPAPTPTFAEAASYLRANGLFPEASPLEKNKRIRGAMNAGRLLVGRTVSYFKHPVIQDNSAPNHSGLAFL